MKAIFAIMNTTQASCKIRSEEQKIQDYTGVELMASAIPIQCPTN